MVMVDGEIDGKNVRIRFSNLIYQNASKCLWESDILINSSKFYHFFPFVAILSLSPKPLANLDDVPKFDKVPMEMDKRNKVERANLLQSWSRVGQPMTDILKGSTLQTILMVSSIFHRIPGVFNLVHQKQYSQF